jgi:hypothetical protein
MGRETTVNTHFHIRWSDGSKLDWERFNNQDDAEVGAQELVRSGESYAIEEFDDSCTQCKSLARLANKAP